MARWLAKLPRPRRVLIAGLPEKYGSSLDFFLLAEQLGAITVVAVDERPSAIDKARRGLATAQANGGLTRIALQLQLVREMNTLNELAGVFDLCLGSEVLQRLNPDLRPKYLARLAQLAPAVALFAPNADDPSHTTLSGLSGLALGDLQRLVAPEGSIFSQGYVDMPPFPPGLTRSTAQRDRAAGGTLEGLAMWGLGYYARVESLFPPEWRRSHSHIVYALLKTKVSSEG